jgi:hypothetical protein
VLPNRVEPLAHHVFLLLRLFFRDRTRQSRRAAAYCTLRTLARRRWWEKAGVHHFLLLPLRTCLRDGGRRAERRDELDEKVIHRWPVHHSRTTVSESCELRGGHGAGDDGGRWKRWVGGPSDLPSSSSSVMRNFIITIYLTYT